MFDTKGRYSRHLLLEGFGQEGQRKLSEGKVLIIGAGGLGSPVALYLAAAGVGTIAIADGDKVETSNLQRQVIHSTRDIGTEKAESAARKLRDINPDITVLTINHFIDSGNIGRTIADYDIVVDATDSYRAKYMINDACVAAAKPFVHGGVLKYEGNVFTHLPGTADYRDIFGAEPTADHVPTASTVGVLSTVVGIIGTIQATEVIKWLTGTGELITDAILTFDSLTWRFNKIEIFKFRK
ncbi:MAG: HesA/MoeB/ThiF family protein [Prevotella sp.]